MKQKKVEILITLCLSAGAVILLCGVSGFSGYESWHKSEIVASVESADTPPAVPAVPVVEPASDIREVEAVREVPVLQPDLPEVPSVGTAPGESRGDDPVFFQLQYLPTNQGYIFGHDRKVYGLALGYYLPQNEIRGVSISFMHIYNMRKYGLSLSLLEMSGEFGGVAMFLAGGVVSNYGLTVGLLNMTENNNGVQIGLVNMDESNLLLDYPQKPVDENEESSFGVQAGLVNFSDSRGIQIGLWNVNPNSWIKYFPIINFCF